MQLYVEGENGNKEVKAHKLPGRRLVDVIEAVEECKEVDVDPSNEQ